MKTATFSIGCILFLLATQIAVAQTENLGGIKYAPLAGWTRTAKDHAVVFSQIDQAKGKFCFITLYAVGPTTGNPQQDFATEWKLRVIDPWGGAANPPTESAPDHGWTATAGGGAIDFEGNKAFAFLTVISGFGKSVSVLGVLNDQSYLPDLQAFVEKLDIDNSIVAPAVPSPPVRPGPALQYDSYGHLLIPAPTRQLTLADMTGQWGEEDGINVTYVDRYSGTYAGTNSLHYRTKMTFAPDGSYFNDFYAIQNGKMIKDKSGGSISIDGRVLSVRTKGVAKYVIRGWLELPNMTILEVCGPWYDDQVIPAEIFSNPDQGANLDMKWVRK
ncbi:MAG: hypothetical protein ABJB34_12780 [Acidobacteriota bacterium]